MANRRQFIQASAAIATAGAPTLSALAKSFDTLPLYKVVFDERFDASREFANEAHKLGARIHGIGGEVHSLWYDDLYHRWKSSPVAIAGMTTYNPMFLLAMMAQDVRMRVIYRAHHRSESASLSHEVFGPYELGACKRELCAAEEAWARAAAQIVMSWPAKETHVAYAQSNIASADGKALEANTLISWIIAPVRRT